jgi:molybdopterin/thiamine biosynthesis adenylyltransferase
MTEQIIYTEEMFQRFIGIFQAQDASVSIAGVGGIGSAVALALAKMGVRYLTLYDFDEVGIENVGTQMYRYSDIGTLKTDALADILTGYVPSVHIAGIPERITPDDPLGDWLVVMAVDGIQTRKDVWQAIKYLGATSWVMDTRMSAESFQLYTIDMADYGWYDQFLAAQDDSSVPDLPCTSKATIYTAFQAAARVGAGVRALLTQTRWPRVIIDDLVNATTLTPGGYHHADNPSGQPSALQTADRGSQS